MLTQELYCLFNSLAPAIRAVLHRVANWRTPQNWSRKDWAEEERAIVHLAACETLIRYKNPDLCPLPKLVYLRGLARALTRYRQECAFSLRHPPLNETNELGGEDDTHVSLNQPSTADAPVIPGQERLMDALESLSAEDQHLMEQIFWHGRTQTDLAREFRISQAAVCQRWRQALEKLRAEVLSCGFSEPGR